MKQLLLICLAVLLSAIYWQYSQDETTPEVLTTPYQELSTELQHRLDTLQPEYDPREFGLGVLKYLQKHKEGPIPFDWDDVVDRGNKTGLGIYHMNKFEVDQIVLLHKTLHHYLTVVPDDDHHLSRDGGSISGAIESFFKDEEEIEVNYDYRHLDATDFKFTKPPPHTRDSTKYRYFKEGSLLNEPGLAHYDLRFYKGRISPIDRIAILHRIVRAWFNFTNQLELNTWIAHGSLLGYFFNGLILPWDDDLDVQITAKSFETLLQYNRSIVIDYNDEMNLGKYLIDLNPGYAVRNKEADNKIDARFIDVESGLYIDITTLSIDTIEMKEFDQDGLVEMYKVFDPNFDYTTMTRVEQTVEEIETEFNSSSQSGELVFCKDYHVYKIDELSPLVPTVFEGSVGFVPNNIQNLLLREYKRKSLYLFQYKTYEFDKLRRIWRHDKIPYEYNELMSNFIKHHESLRQGVIKRSEFHSADLDHIFPSFRTDPWLRLLTEQWHINTSNSH